MDQRIGSITPEEKFQVEDPGSNMTRASNVILADKASGLKGHWVQM